MSEEIITKTCCEFCAKYYECDSIFHCEQFEGGECKHKGKCNKCRDFEADGKDPYAYDTH